MKTYFGTFLYCLIAISLGFTGLSASIEKVTIRWTPMQCENLCIRDLEKQFRKIPGVAEVAIDKAAGTAELKWGKNQPFAFSPVNVAMSLLGLTINDIRVRVRGKLQHTTQNVTLISEGDNTRFELLNPVVPLLNRQSAQFNIGARALTPELRQKLIEAEVAEQIATIEGPLLFPERSPPLTLVVDALGLTTPEDHSQKHPSPTKK